MTSNSPHGNGVQQRNQRGKQPREITSMTFKNRQPVTREPRHVKIVSPSTILQREKREWQWNTLLAYEEKDPQSPPEIIGKLRNTLSKDFTEFQLMGDGANDIFKLSKSGDVLLLKKLDREKISSYNLKARILNSKTKEIIEPDTEFTIKVQDINDHTPMFVEPGMGSVYERAKRGTMVLRVNATDKDDPTSPNGIVTYKLLNGSNIFSIEPKTGEISTINDEIDREDKSEYKLIVQASDMFSNEGGRSASIVVTINVNDINDNLASFSEPKYEFNVKEDTPMGFKIGILYINDRDEKQNKKPTFTVETYKDIFDLERDDNNDGVLILKKKLDFETKEMYSFTVTLKESVVQKPDNVDQRMSAQIIIKVIDVDEPPVFSQANYTFNVVEGQTNIIVGSVFAKDTDKSSYRIRYSIKESTNLVNINGGTGQLTLKNPLDREVQKKHLFLVTAEEESPDKLKSSVMVILNVLDINDNYPKLGSGSDLYICENDESGTVIGVINATDIDENPGTFRFALLEKSSNFSLRDNQDNTASIILTQGGFSSKSSVLNVLKIEITDGGIPPKKSTEPLYVRVCECGRERQTGSCQAYQTSSISFSALIAILLCIITILVIVILFVLRKRYKKGALVDLGKCEIHEQLVEYDEEGGGEMDTNIYDVSILTSARADPRLGPDPLPPAMYAVVKKPSACKGDMAVMIEVKKDEADHDRDGIPYDTLHIYGYEGSESLAGSLSSLGSASSFGSELDYDFLSDWGPRFRTLAQIYGSEVNTSY
ncbi:cadherin-5 precursor [Silurus meridionalis]|nr:cadherin-5 precursor [Silurus meridionalis]